MVMNIVGIVILGLVCTGIGANAIFTNNEIGNLFAPGDLTAFSNPSDIFRNSYKRRCPLCDPSIYSYCTDKLFHDSCCCNNPNNPYEQLPYQCKFADCSFLHANSCSEHKLITACCCISLYR
ncbi:uncharacterized protein LOC130894276 isoform X1 [Diorhabda carinulata]|uniref:uncharacterized protein LOC130894276 isoform X1 n=1 Tax=Diorhabda carinulata TaxID=1163345 RepID=UPI0025A165E2|nr:uncharacterized protein LOC130894276 isoform X1 [Diorhabda carinulata]